MGGGGIKGGSTAIQALKESREVIASLLKPFGVDSANDERTEDPPSLDSADKVGGAEWSRSPIFVSVEL